MLRYSPLVLSFNSPWECRIGLTNFTSRASLCFATNTFNSPWECRIGLTQTIILHVVQPLIATFQFPVGMSNRSYIVNSGNMVRDCCTYFQFPVGMSNRSYAGFADGVDDTGHFFQFPVGMSNRSYDLVWMRGQYFLRALSIPRGNVE